MTVSMSETNIKTTLFPVEVTGAGSTSPHNLARLEAVAKSLEIDVQGGPKVTPHLIFRV